MPQVKGPIPDPITGLSYTAHDWKVTCSATGVALPLRLKSVQENNTCVEISIKKKKIPGMTVISREENHQIHSYVYLFNKHMRGCHKENQLLLINFQSGRFEKWWQANTHHASSLCARVCVCARAVYSASIPLHPLRISRLKTVPAVIAWPFTAAR